MKTTAQRYVTFSVDDGVPQDLRTAELLDEFGLKATFYIPARNPQAELLGPTNIRDLSTGFEVGAHSFNHRPLKGLTDAEIRDQVSRGKIWLEDTISGEVSSFCYPFGKFDRQVARVVKECGFIGARTCQFNRVDWPADPFSFGVSTHAYSHSRAVQLWHAAIERNFLGMWNYSSLFQLTRDWSRHFTLALDHVEHHGGIAHLYFHSWEIDQQGHWDKLTTVLRDAASRTGFQRVTNGDLFRMLRAGEIAA
jgi:peptidoglycan-N-acetylglucosamine deacetylase